MNVDETLVNRVAASLNEQGYYVGQEVISLDEYRSIANSLGRPILETEVMLDPSREASVYSPKEMPFHTDHVRAQFIGWYCIVPHNGIDGATLLMDSRKAFENLSMATLSSLKAISIAMPSLSPREEDRNSFDYSALCDSDERIHYAPWYVQEPKDSGIRKALRSFQAQIETTESFGVKLERGQYFFIDNRRILHARGALEPESKRKLLRIWIEKKEE